VNSYNTIINNVVVRHNLGIVFWYSGEWPTQALNDQSGLRYDVIANNTLVNNKGSLNWDASPAHVGTTIENNLFVTAAGTSPLYLLQAKSAGGISLDRNLWFAPDLTQPFLWLGGQSDHAGFVAASSQGGGRRARGPVARRSLGGAPGGEPRTHGDLAAIGAGVDLAAVTHDFLDALRPATGTVIGAFQYGAMAPGDSGAGPTADAGVGQSSEGGVASAPAGGVPDETGDDAATGQGPDGGGPAGASDPAGCSSSQAGIGSKEKTSPADRTPFAVAMGLALPFMVRGRSRVGRGSSSKS
jgi:hypothetical protein